MKEKRNSKSHLFQVSASKTFDIDADTFWGFFLSEKGTSLWLGKDQDGEISLNSDYHTDEESTMRITVFKIESHIRLSYLFPNNPHKTFVEIRVRKARNKITVTFHHSDLQSEQIKEKMRIHWKQLLNSIYSCLISSVE